MMAPFLSRAESTQHTSSHLCFYTRGRPGDLQKRSYLLTRCSISIVLEKASRIAGGDHIERPAHPFEEPTAMCGSLELGNCLRVAMRSSTLPLCHVALISYLELLVHSYFTTTLASKRSMTESSPSHSRQFFRRSLCAPGRVARNSRTRTPAAPIAPPASKSSLTSSSPLVVSTDQR
jgi:hypothetical protein